jgi:hypothetical protein
MGILEEEMLEIHRLKSEMSIPHSHDSRKSSNDNQSTHSSQLSAGDSAAAYNYSKALNGGSFPDYIDCRYYSEEATDVLISELNKLRLEKVKWDQERRRLEKKVSNLEDVDKTKYVEKLRKKSVSIVKFQNDDPMVVE